MSGVLFASVILTDILRCTDIILFHFLVTVVYMHVCMLFASYLQVRQVHRHAGHLIVYMWNKTYAKNQKLFCEVGPSKSEPIYGLSGTFDLHKCRATFPSSV